MAGRDRTGVVIALIQYICGATHEQIVSDYLMSHQGTNANDIQEVLDTVYRNPSLFFASCGLNDEVISSLRNQFSTATNCEHAVLPDILISKRRYRFISGEPTCPCRPFLADELQAMKQFMMHSVPGGQLHPTLVVVTGLPGGGKSALGDSILLQLGIDPKHCVDIDMDIVRCFHTQLQLMRNRSAASSESNQNDVLLSYDELLPWFMRGASNMETLLYADTNGVVQTALQCRCHIFLPCVISNRQTLSFIKDCVALYGYRICLVGVHSSLERAVQRAATRGYLTGRFTPSVYIENCCQSVRENFIDATRFVNSCDGTIMLYDNETDKETNSHLLPKLCFFSCRGEIKLVDERVSSMYELPTVLQDKCAAQNDIIVRSPQLPTAEESSNEEFNFYTDGFVLLGNCVDPNIVRAMGDRFESQIAQFASNNEVTMQEYLSVINKWSHCNSVVMDIMMEISNLLRRKVAEILNSAVAWPVGAVLFRKSSITDEASCVPTHAHQDIAYARFPGSQMFRVTTWVPLVLNNSDTLAFTRGSHKMEVSPVADFLSTASNVEATTQQCDTAVPVQYGDAILFDARVWHRSTAFPPADSVETSSSGLRLAVGIQWLTPGGLDGLKQGAYFRWPESDVPATVDVMALRRKGIFGVDTAGWFLKCALLAVKEEIDAIRGESVHSVPSEYRSSSDRNQKKKDRYLRFVDPDNPHVCELQLFSTLSMAAEICNEANAVAVDVLRKLKCSPSEAQSALKRYVLFRKASRRDFGEAQGAKVFGPLHNYFINPILFAED